MIALWEVIRKKSISLSLQLAQATEIHNLFHLNSFWKDFINLLSAEISDPVWSIMIYKEDKCEIVDVFDARSFLGKI